MGKNEEMGLPYAKMKKVVVAFDIDGTLRSNKTETSEEPNKRIVELVKILSSFKNTRVIAWSGGGADYAWRFIRLYKLEEYISEDRCYSKMNYILKYGSPDLAIDDIQDTAIGRVNLIVWEK